MIVSDELWIHGRGISWPTLGYCNHRSSGRLWKTRKLWVITAIVLNTYVPNVERKCQASSDAVLCLLYWSDIPGGTYTILTWDMVACLLLRSACSKYRALRSQCKGSQFSTTSHRRILPHRCQIFINVRHVLQWNQKHFYKVQHKVDVQLRAKCSSWVICSTGLLYLHKAIAS